MIASPSSSPVNLTLPAPRPGPIWHCDAQAVTCQHGHLWRHYKHGYRADFRRLSGHAFLECQQCVPPTFIFAHFITQPSPMVMCYAIDFESFKTWSKTEEPTPPTTELLYLLRDPEGRNYNPSFRGAA